VDTIISSGISQPFDGTHVSIECPNVDFLGGYIMKQNNNHDNFVKALVPLIIVLFGTTIAYSFTHQGQNILEIFASETTLKTLLPGFCILVFSVSKIRSEASQYIFLLLIFACIAIIINRLIHGTFLTMNAVLSILYVSIGTYIGFNSFTDTR